MVPSIKGSAFQSVIEDVKRLVDAGRLDLDDLELGLSDKDRRVLDEVITPVSWLPIDVYGRLLAALAQAEAPRDQITYRGSAGDAPPSACSRAPTRATPPAKARWRAPGR